MTELLAVYVFLAAGYLDDELLAVCVCFPSCRMFR